jgi:hypothetical protein
MKCIVTLWLDTKTLNLLGGDVEALNRIDSPSSFKHALVGGMGHLNLPSPRDVENLRWCRYKKTIGLVIEDGVTYNPLILTLSHMHSGLLARTASIDAVITFSSKTSYVEGRYSMNSERGDGNSQVRAVLMSESSNNGYAEYTLTISGAFSMGELTDLFEKILSGREPERVFKGSAPAKRKISSDTTMFVTAFFLMAASGLVGWVLSTIHHLPI